MAALPIHQLREAAARQAEAPARVPKPVDDRIVAVVEYRDGTVIDTVRQTRRAGEATARRMLSAQASRAARLAIAHDVIRNEGDIAGLAAQVADLHRRYLRLSSALSA